MYLDDDEITRLQGVDNFLPTPLGDETLRAASVLRATIGLCKGCGDRKQSYCEPARDLGLRWQAKRDTALAGPSTKAPSSLRSAGAVQDGPAPRDLISELGLTNTRHDLVCLHLNDPRETELPEAGLLTIEDAETGELMELDSGRFAVRNRFTATNAERLAELDRALNRTGVDTIRLSTAEPFAPLLQRFFEIRRGRRRG